MVVGRQAATCDEHQLGDAGQAVARAAVARSTKAYLRSRRDRDVTRCLQRRRRLDECRSRSEVIAARRTRLIPIPIAPWHHAAIQAEGSPSGPMCRRSGHATLSASNQPRSYSTPPRQAASGASSRPTDSSAIASAIPAAPCANPSSGGPPSCDAPGGHAAPQVCGTAAVARLVATRSARARQRVDAGHRGQSFEPERRPGDAADDVQI